LNASVDRAVDRVVDPVVDVAVGIQIRDDGSFLLAERPTGKPMAGWWEFPGGKLERGESVFDALAREFDEELGLHIVTAHPWVQRVVAYPHATVRLHYWRSFGEDRGWRGTPRSNEGQAFRWERIDRLTTDPWLKGAEPVKRWLRLPATYAISNAMQMGTSAFMAVLDRRLSAGAIQQLQLREPGMDDEAFDALFEAVALRCEAHAVRLLVNGTHPERYWSRASGVHLTARALMRIDHRPDVDWCFASCHDAREIARAGDLAIDAAVLGPVRPTASHPGAVGLGWDGFEEAIASTALPVYALGGLDRNATEAAIAAGAQGIAMMRSVWS
jgi:8-oxo-dGTP diphosphatase